MEYTLHLAAPNEDIVPLYCVAVEMAMSFAAAGGTSFHKPAYNGRLTDCILELLEEVRVGDLKVCNAQGRPVMVDKNKEATEHFGYATRFINEPDWEKLRRENPPIREGVWDFTHIDLGPREIDKNCPNIAWFAKLKMLNEWAEKRGDSFVISHEGVGWVDERGYNEPTNQNTADTKAFEQKHGVLNDVHARQPKKKETDPAPDLSEIEPDKWYHTHQAARFLGMNPKYLSNDLIQNGRLKAVKRGRRNVIQGKEILTYAKKYPSNS